MFSQGDFVTQLTAVDGDRGVPFPRRVEYSMGEYKQGAATATLGVAAPWYIKIRFVAV